MSVTFMKVNDKIRLMFVFSNFNRIGSYSIAYRNFFIEW